MSKHRVTWLERILALVLVCVMVLGMVPGAVFAVETPEEPTEPVETTQPTVPTEPVVTSEPSETTEPTEPSEPSEPEDDKETTKLELHVTNMAGEAMANVPVFFVINKGGAVINIPSATDDNGVAGVALNGAENTPNLKVTYSIELSGYDTISGELTIANPVAEVKLAKLLTLKIDKAGEGSVELTSTDTITRNQDGTYTVVEGSSVTVDAKAADGYQVEGITVDDDILVGSSFTATANSTIRVVFAQVYTVTIICNGDGTITVEDHTAVSEGTVSVKRTEDGKISITVNANTANKYCIGSVKILDAKSEAVQEKVYETVVTTDLFEVAWDQNYQVMATFVPDSYAVTTKVTAELKNNQLDHENKLVIDQEQVHYMGSYTINVVPAAGYILSKLTVGGVDYTTQVTDNKLTISNVVDAQNIEAEFQYQRVTVTLPQNANGGSVWFGTKETVTEQKEQTVLYGDNVEFYILADENYQFDPSDFKINGMEYNAQREDKAWNFCNITKDDSSDIWTVVITEIKADLRMDLDFATSTANKSKVSITAVNGQLISDKFQNGIEIFIFSKDTESVVIASNDNRNIRGQRKSYYGYYGNVYNNGEWLPTITMNNSSYQNVDYLDRVIAVSKHTWAETLWGQTAYFVIDRKNPVIENLKFNGQAEAKDFYNKSVEVTFSAKDANTYAHDYLDFASGIDSVQYLIYTTDEMPAEAAWETMIPNENGDYSFYINAMEYMVENVNVVIRVADKAGNVTSKNASFGFNPVTPTVTVEVTDEADDLRNPDNIYYKNNRTFTITVVDKAYTFDTAESNFSDESGLLVAFRDSAEGRENELAWEYINNGWGDIQDLGNGFIQATMVIHTADTGEFFPYFRYTNKADTTVENEDIEYTGENSDHFIVDKIAPAGKIMVDGAAWESLLHKLSFGAYAKSVTVSSEWSDIAFGDVAGNIYGEVLYYGGNISMLTDETTNELLSEDLLLKKLDEMYAAGEFQTDLGTVSADGNYVFFTRAVDQAGNVTYIASNGVVVDNVQSRVVVGVHNDSALAEGKTAHKDDIKMEVTVDDMVDQNGTYSGIQKITYTIENSDKSKVYAGTLLERENKPEPTMTPEELKEASSFNGTFMVYVEKEDNGHGNKDDNKVRFNEKDVIVTVTVTDFAGNTISDIYNLNVNTVRPVIEITPEKWVKEDAKPEAVDGYYNPGRTLTITITDREYTFVAENVVFNLTCNGTKVETLDMSAWVHDGDKHTITLNLSEDGVYNLSVAYINAANMAAETATVETFTVDHTNPTAVITVGENKWDDFLEKITFGLYTNNAFVASVAAKDDTSPVTVYWYLTDSADEADEINEENVADLEWSKLGGGKKEATYEGEFEAEQRYTFYIKVIDYAGNVIYLNSDGVILDKTSAEITLTPEEIVSEKGKTNGIYGTDNEIIGVNVDVTEDAQKQYAGIDTIEYWVYSSMPALADLSENATAEEVAAIIGEAESTAYGILFDYNEADPVYSELQKDVHGAITVNPETNNFCDAAVLIKVVDNAGNVSYKAELLDIDVTKPVIEVAYTDEDENGVSNGKYYQTARTATVTITERAHHFNPEDVVVVITAKDAAGNDVMVGEQKLADTMKLGEFVSNGDVHTATIVFEQDANYTFTVDYVDNAGNAADQYVADDFVVDKTNPVGTITATTPVYDDNGEFVRSDEATYESLLEDVLFSYWTKNPVSISATGADVTSDVEKIEYFVHQHVTDEENVAQATILTKEDLDSKKWTDINNPGNDLPLMPNGQYVVYLKITDYAGNYTYISTNCLIVDNDAPDKDILAPNIESSIENDALFNKDVPVDIKVSEQVFGNTFSGLKSVSYEIYNLGILTESKILYTYNSKNEASLRREFIENITVSASENNSNDVRVVVYAEDNAGNKDMYEIGFKIDITAPVITVDYDNNEADGVYYKANRTATIRVQERNFDYQAVQFNIGVSPDGESPKMSAWRTIPGKAANGDDTCYEIDLVYGVDGDYTFDVAYTDRAGNAADGWSNADAAVTNSAAFTIDKTLPVISVKYNNNNAVNGKYFAATRTATITIAEHNFDPQRVKLELKGARGGVVPSYRWSTDSSGNIHTAVLDYKIDGDYAFQISMTDLAGNANSGVGYNNAVAPNDFVVDTHADMIVVTDVENGEAYGYDETLVPNVSISDINLDTYSVTLTGIQKGKTIDLSDKANALLRGNGGNISGLLDLFTKDPALDGIYTLKVNSQDMAGNTDEEIIVFTVNRFGSVYVYGEYLTEVIDKRYNQAIDEDLIIHEFNADKLIAGSLRIEITLDGRPLENIIYTATPSDMNPQSTGESGWYEYTYVISKDNFQADGIYTISVSTVDATGNTPENSNYQDMGIEFMVDNTIPEISIITGLEDISVYSDEQRVDFTVFDAIGLESIVVYIDGEVYETFTEFDDDLNNYSGFFTIYEKDAAQNVRIVVTDLAGKIIDTDLYGVANEDGVVEIAEPEFEFNRAITVSTNRLALWFNNKPLFWGSIAGVGGLGLIFLLIILFKRKKNEDEEEAQASAK